MAALTDAAGAGSDISSPGAPCGQQARPNRTQRTPRVGMRPRATQWSEALRVEDSREGEKRHEVPTRAEREEKKEKERKKKIGKLARECVDRITVTPNVNVLPSEADQRCGNGGQCEECLQLRSARLLKIADEIAVDAVMSAATVDGKLLPSTAKRERRGRSADRAMFQVVLNGE
ncbi:hypothetical protein R3P38DRAFT_2806235 [Favolaschia claudopus]|uniref:Uncharacterized protein n=1 Tax=Favolaschia claudopus TaxID=2862362 RepID=A0AAV9ZKW3_9AGAR